MPRPHHRRWRPYFQSKRAAGLDGESLERGALRPSHSDPRQRRIGTQPLASAQSRYNHGIQPKRSQRMSVRSTITAQFEQVALEQKRKLAPLTDGLRLLD